MEERRLPIRFFVKPSNSFSNNIIFLNQEEGIIGETTIRYRNESLRVWEVKSSFLEILWKNKPSFPGFGFKVYAEINDRIQTWRLLEFRKKARIAKVRKYLEKIGRRKAAKERRQAALA